MAVYSDLGLTNQLCSSSGSSVALPETCVATTPVGVTEIFLTVVPTPAGGNVGADYIIEVIPQPTAGEGGTGAGNPTDITALPDYFGIVGGIATESFYKVTGLTATNQYFATLTGLSGDVDLEVYPTNAFTTPLTCLGSESAITESCLVTSSGTELFIKVISAESDGAFFTVNLLDPPVNEGTSSVPIDITGLTPYPGEIGAGSTGVGISYYFIENLVPNAEALVSLTSVTDDIKLEVFDDQFVTSLCTSSRSNGGGRVPENCTGSDGVVTSPSGSLYIKVEVQTPGATEDGATFEINVLQ
jgi:hypothetical protein